MGLQRNKTFNRSSILWSYIYSIPDCLHTHLKYNYFRKLNRIGWYKMSMWF